MFTAADYAYSFTVRDHLKGECAPYKRVGLD